MDPAGLGWAATRCPRLACCAARWRWAAVRRVHRGPKLLTGAPLAPPWLPLVNLVTQAPRRHPSRSPPPHSRHNMLHAVQAGPCTTCIWRPELTPSSDRVEPPIRPARWHCNVTEHRLAAPGTPPSLAQLQAAAVGWLLSNLLGGLVASMQCRGCWAQLMAGHDKSGHKLNTN